MNGTITRGSIKTQRKEEKETVSSHMRRRLKLWGTNRASIKKLNLNSDESEVRGRWMKLWGLSNLNSVRLKSDGRRRKRKAQRGDSWRKLRKDIGFPPNKRENSTKTKEREKKEKRSIFPISLSLCPLLTPLCNHKSNDNFSAHFKIEINYFYLLDMIHAL